jgi:hypothetical protein
MDNYEKVPIWHFPLPEGSPPVLTGHYFRRNRSIIDFPMVPDIEAMLSMPPSDDKGGGSTADLIPEPKGPKPIGSKAQPLPKLPKVLRA